MAKQELETVDDVIATVRYLDIGDNLHVPALGSIAISALGVSPLIGQRPVVHGRVTLDDEPQSVMHEVGTTDPVIAVAEVDLPLEPMYASPLCQFVKTKLEP